jgi:hypothetical protein
MVIWVLAPRRTCHFFFFFPVPVCAITASGVPVGTLVSMNRFTTLCGWLAQRRGGEWRGEYDRVSKLDRLKLTPDLTTRWTTGNDKFVYSSLWAFKSSLTCRKILRHGTFLLYFPSERKMCCGFLSPLKTHHLGRVLNPQPLGPLVSTLTTTPQRRRKTRHNNRNTKHKSLTWNRTHQNPAPSCGHDFNL